MNNAYLLIGGNLGDRLGNLKNATKEIELHCGKILSSSAIYETAAWGFTEQPPFFNQALQVETALSATELMQQLLSIELSLGRERLLPLGPRSIDLDIIYFNNEIIHNDIVSIPHPRMEQRNFVLIPLNEIAPTFLHPVLHISTSSLLEQCKDESHVYKKTTN
ncbi:MAG: 2-amino-4-hydroxy-6-hydroxymethyldihydropteridine diphosphokinase [Chitinophagaceae bacterium]|nr:2-amino-4-hydroxy-6-hydroxymethyldihydropteridine diphosphokinase [Chitinophagaceae bacterium]